MHWLPVGLGSNFPKFHQRSHHDVITSLEHWTTYFQCLWPVCCSWVLHRLYFLPKGEKNAKLQPLQCRAVVRFSNQGGADRIRLFIFLSVYFSKHPNYSLPPPLTTALLWMCISTMTYLMLDKVLEFSTCRSLMFAHHNTYHTFHSIASEINWSVL